MTSNRVLSYSTVVLLTSTLLLAGCAEVVESSPGGDGGGTGGTGGEPANAPPQITAGPTAMPTAILDSETSSISAVGMDPDGDTLTFDGSIAPDQGSVSAFAVDGDTGTATYTPPQVWCDPLEEEPCLFVYSVAVSVSDGTASSQPSSVNVTITPTPAIALDEAVFWTATMIKVDPPGGDPPFSPIEISLEQDDFVLSGSRFNSQHEFTATTSGTIDGFGSVNVTCLLDNGGDGTYAFEGTVSGSDGSQTIQGTYDYHDAAGGSLESGTFTMDHN